jgi:hypothetical protein
MYSINTKVCSSQVALEGMSTDLLYVLPVDIKHSANVQYRPWAAEHIALVAPLSRSLDQVEPV